MASFFEDLWTSVFTPGPTPTLLVATNATFASLQLLLLILLVATYSIHFVILSCLSGGLWYAINWFARELLAQKAKDDAIAQMSREKSLDPGSETETETETAPVQPQSRSPTISAQQSSSLLHPEASQSEEHLRRRKSLGDNNSGYVSTDSEWEKVSEGEERER